MLLTGYYNVRKENLMNKELRAVADNIIDAAIKAVLPDEAVKKTLKDRKFDGKVILVAVGKAAWQMAKAASDCLGDRINEGIVITKYGHVKEPIERIECFEAGHPVPDENSFKATQAAIEMVSGLNKNDTVLFLLSGGGSALPCNGGFCNRYHDRKGKHGAFCASGPAAFYAGGRDDEGGTFNSAAAGSLRDDPPYGILYGG